MADKKCVPSLMLLLKRHHGCVGHRRLHGFRLESVLAFGSSTNGYWWNLDANFNSHRQSNQMNTCSECAYCVKPIPLTWKEDWPLFFTPMILFWLVAKAFPSMMAYRCGAANSLTGESRIGEEPSCYKTRLFGACGAAGKLFKPIAK